MSNVTTSEYIELPQTDEKNDCFIAIENNCAISELSDIDLLRHCFDDNLALEKSSFLDSKELKIRVCYVMN